MLVSDTGLKIDLISDLVDYEADLIIKGTEGQIDCARKQSDNLKTTAKILRAKAEIQHCGLVLDKISPREMIHRSIKARIEPLATLHIG